MMYFSTIFCRYRDQLHALIHRSLGFDYQGIETLQIKPGDWHSIAVILYVYGYNYLRSQCAYDVAPGGLLASVYHLTRIEYGVDQPEEVCIKVFAPRKDPRIPSVFWFGKVWIFKNGNLMICWESLMLIIHV
ncbi:putative NADH:ubiquinone oxidoreductase, 30kDa subunit [Helianthus debilis subsp. tardiflorus]